MTNELTRKEFLRTVATVGSAAVVGTACGTTASASTGGLAENTGSSLALRTSRLYANSRVWVACGLIRSRCGCDGTVIDADDDEVPAAYAVLEHLAAYNFSVDPTKWKSVSDFVTRAKRKSLSEIKTFIPKDINDDLICQLMGIDAPSDIATMADEEIAKRVARTTKLSDGTSSDLDSAATGDGGSGGGGGSGASSNSCCPQTAAQNVVAMHVESPLDGAMHVALVKEYLAKTPKAIQPAALTKMNDFFSAVSAAAAPQRYADAREVGTIVVGTTSTKTYQEAMQYAEAYSTIFQGHSGMNAAFASSKNENLKRVLLRKYDRKGG